jgi:hypothetical protein
MSCMTFAANICHTVEKYSIFCRHQLLAFTDVGDGPQVIQPFGKSEENCQNAAKFDKTSINLWVSVRYSGDFALRRPPFKFRLKVDFCGTRAKAKRGAMALFHFELIRHWEGW